MTFSLHGLAVSSGIAIGRAHLVSHATLEVAHYKVRDKDMETLLTRTVAGGRDGVLNMLKH